MARAVLFVGTTTIGGKPRTICTIEEAFDTDAEASFEFKCRAHHRTFANLRNENDSERVRKAGEMLYGAIAAHEAVRGLFTHMTKDRETYPFYIRSEAPAAEQFPWEAMWSTTQRNFVALHEFGRWPIARLAIAKRGLFERTAAKEMRIAVILAAAGREDGAATEWEGLRDAFPKLGFPVSVLGLVSQDQMITTLTQGANSQVAGTNIKAKYVGNTAKELIEAIRDYSPNIIHFFCHGTAGGNRPTLEIETRADYKEKKAGSIRLTSTELSQLAELRSLWLVVLNCCQGGTPAPFLTSLARRLVKDGAPAVVAMRESVDVDDANLFSRHLYPEVLQQINTHILTKRPAPGTNWIEIGARIWATAVQKARFELSSGPGRTPEACPEWTYPVVYVSRDRLRLLPEIEKAAATVLLPNQRKKLESALEYLRKQRETLATSAIQDGQQFIDSIDAALSELEKKLKDN